MNKIEYRKYLGQMKKDCSTTLKCVSCKHLVECDTIKSCIDDSIGLSKYPAMWLDEQLDVIAENNNE